MLWVMPVLCKILFFWYLLTLVACHNLPESTRHGDIKEIVIGERFITGPFEVTAGDEMRWTNRQLAPVRITLLDYVLNTLSCRRNFSGHYYSGAESSLLPNESASLCFSKPGTVRYAVHAQGLIRTGESNVSQLYIEPFYRQTLEQVEEKQTSVSRTVDTAWCADDTTTHEQCL